MKQQNIKTKRPYEKQASKSLQEKKITANLEFYPQEKKCVKKEDKKKIIFLDKLSEFASMMFIKGNSEECT